MANQIVTIDGPAGSGKSSLAKILSRVFDFFYLSSGGIYRVFAYAVIRELNIKFFDMKLLTEELTNSFVSIVFKKISLDSSSQSKVNFMLDLHLVDESSLDSLLVNQVVPVVSMNAFVRQHVVDLQRSFSRDRNLVVEGRDCGTEVFPQATVKLFVDASSDVRAERIWLRMKQKSQVDLESVKKMMQERDELDKTRKISPLEKAKDALVVDTSGISLNDVVKKVVCLVAPKLKF